MSDCTPDKAAHDAHVSAGDVGLSERLGRWVDACARRVRDRDASLDARFPEARPAWWIIRGLIVMYGVAAALNGYRAAVTFQELLLPGVELVGIGPSRFTTLALGFGVVAGSIVLGRATRPTRIDRSVSMRWAAAVVNGVALFELQQWLSRDFIWHVYLAPHPFS